MQPDESSKLEIFEDTKQISDSIVVTVSTCDDSGPTASVLVSEWAKLSMSYILWAIIKAKKGRWSIWIWVVQVFSRWLGLFQN